MQCYLFEYDENTQKIIHRVRKQLMKYINQIFPNCQYNIDNFTQCISSFLISCGVNEYVEWAHVNCHHLFYPALMNVDFSKIYNLIRKYCVPQMPKTLLDYSKMSKCDWTIEETDQYINLNWYIDDYIAALIAAWIQCNDNNFKLTNDNKKLLCTLIIDEFISKLYLIDEEKCDLASAVDKRLKELIDNNKELQESNIVLKKENVSLKNQLYLIKNKSDKPKTIIDNTKINELNKEIRKKDLEIQSLKNKIYELSIVFDKTIKKECNPCTKELDFNKHVIFVGGHDNTIASLQRLFPNAKFISHERDNLDKSTISHCEAIIFLTSFMSHSLYYKIKNILNGINQLHCSFDNVAKILECMLEYEYLQLK